MNFEFTNKLLHKEIDCYVFLVSKEYSNTIKTVEDNLGIFFPNNFKYNFKGRSGEIKLFYYNNFTIILGGIGCINGKNIDKTISIIGKKLKKSNYDRILIGSFSELNEENLLSNQFESLINSMYKFEKYINSNDSSSSSNRIYLYSEDINNAKCINESIYVGKLLDFTRDMVNEPANIVNSIYIENTIKSLFEQSNIEIEILNQKELKKENLNLILAVNRGSDNPAKMIILRNKLSLNSPEKKSKIFLGKGVTFDSGGLSIKLRGMEEMKCDMEGAAIIISLFRYINEYKLQENYIGIIPLVENMINSNSIRPGDIIKSYSKKTVEIVNTDAEGRLILADGISYGIKNFNPEYVINRATLTGSAFNTFNGLSMVMLGTNKKLKNDIKYAAKLKNEKIWTLPLWRDYIKLTKSEIADITNSSIGVRAGTIMAAAFLKNFVKKNIKWIHIDIAGVNFIQKDSKTLFSGSTCIGLRTLIQFVKNDSNNA